MGTKKIVIRKAWAISLYDGTGIYGEATQMGIYGTCNEARTTAELYRMEYGRDKHCKIKVFPVQIKYAK
jgi:hypothetical protein